MGYSEDSKLEARFNITKFVKTGENLIALEIFRWCDGSYLEDQDFWRLTGLSRDVYVYSREKNRLEDIRVVASASGEAKLHADVSKGVTKVSFEILDPYGNLVAETEVAPKKNVAETVLNVADVKQWSAETPWLYTLNVSSYDKKGRTESASIEIGFRDVCIEGGQLLVNGKPVLIKGANRHEMNPYKGYVVTEADMIQDMLDNQSNPTIAPYAKTGEVHLRVTAKAADEKSANKLIKPVVKQLKTRLAEYIYTTDENTTLENAIVDLLVANKLTVSTVESCTGGMIAARLINVPGVSDVFKMGHITYSNKSKKKILGVKKRTLEKHTAVSAEVAKEMVKGVELVSKADVCVSVTGLAGPDGGSEKRPVGLVYIACSIKGNVTVQEYYFNGNREKVRENATAAALTLMRKCILEYMTETAFLK